MPLPIHRRAFLLAAAVPFTWSARRAEAGERETAAESELARLGRASGGRLGVYALHTATGETIRYRADERFPLCSTFKVILCAAILERSTREAGLLERPVQYVQADLVTYSPITEKHLGEGMTVAELCRAALQHSDNTAANLLMKLLGGPAAVTAFARSIGDRTFRLDRWETELNTALPGDPRDTTTPAAMARSLRALVLGGALPQAPREQLQTWLRGNTTGAKRIRAGLPADWQVGDKTGSGDYGTTNDVAVLWPPSRPPIVLAVYYAQRQAEAKWRDDLLAAAARAVAGAWG